MGTTQNILNAFLGLLEVKHTGSFTDQYFNEHPYRYLLGLSKILSDYGVENGATQITDKERDFSEIVTPFIAQFGGSFVIIYKVDSAQVSFLWEGVNHILPVDKFIESWTGVVLLAEASKKSIEPDYKDHRKAERPRMKRIIIINIILSLLFFSINSQENKIGSPLIIDLESGLKNLSRLNVSDFGKTVRFIPLETTDDGLVGRDPVVKVLKNYILVEFRNRPYVDMGVCLLFSKIDGRFIAKIGHSGQDPAAYTNCFSWTDEKEEFLYFERQPNQLIKYDMKGNFCGKVEFSSFGLASYYVITDSAIIGYFDAMKILKQTSKQYSLGIFDKAGNSKDSILSFYNHSTPFTEDLYQTNVIGGSTLYKFYGSWIRNGFFLWEYTPARHKRQINPLHAARIWKDSENIRFKQDFIDTIYTVSGSKLIPAFAFNTGKHHWPVQERKSEKNNSERIFIADVYENNNFVFFQCIKGMFSGPSDLYNGLYNKKTGKTKLGLNSDGIEDDLIRFMPFKPLGMSTSGEFVSLIEVWEVMDWLEKHPEAKNNEKLSFLKKLDEEDNPIVILIE